jgi:hypothetical protein
MPLTTAPLPRSPGRFLAVLGFALALLGVLAYIAQVWMQWLWAPWYWPIAATLGVVLVIVALWQARSLWRFLGLVLVLLIAGAGWAALIATRLPAYTGPVAAGRPFPVFVSSRADGSAFMQGDLAGPQNTALVFFRGRW